MSNNNKQYKKDYLIVHGIHLALWALDVSKKKLSIGDKISIEFQSQVNLNMDVDVKWDDLNNIITLNNSHGLKFCSIEIQSSGIIAKAKPSNNPVLFRKACVQPADLKIKDVKLNKKLFDLL